MEMVLALSLAFHCSSRRGGCAGWGPGICSIARAPRANMPIIAIPIRSRRIELSLGTRRLYLHRGNPRLICRQIIGLRPGYAVDQAQVATRFGCRVSRPQAASFSPLQGLFLFTPAIPGNDPTQTQRRRGPGSLFGIRPYKLKLLCLSRDNMMSESRERVDRRSRCDGTGGSIPDDPAFVMRREDHVMRRE